MRNMKLMILALVAILATTCASTNTKSKMNTYEESIRLGKDVFVENKTFNEPINFTKMVPSNLVNVGLNQVTIKSSVTFINCTFNEEVIAYTKDENGNTIYTSFQSNLSFINCTFNGPVNFRSANVLGRVVYSGSYFDKPANFEECSFQQLVHFTKCTFFKELRFQNAFFMQRANFINAEFDANASFQGSTFISTAQFSNTKFFGYADFSLMNWKGDVFFNYAEIADRSTFSSSMFWGIADFLNVSFGVAEMNNCDFLRLLSLTGSEISRQLQFTNNFFLKEKADLSFIEESKIILE